MSLEHAIITAGIGGDKLLPELSKSSRYKHWLTNEDNKRCPECEAKHGQIFPINENVKPAPPLHLNCRCWIEIMETIKAGTATINSIDGADWWIANIGELPKYYASYEYALSKGWRPRKWPSNFIPNQMITRGQYFNDDGHLPSAPGRVWFEADINYKLGKRNSQRVLWSNDGLIFVTYDHYETFYEII